jgi:hypothetical protein
MPLHGGLGIARAGRLVAAGRAEPRRNQEPVEPQGARHERSGCASTRLAQARFAPTRSAIPHRIPSISRHDRPAAADLPITTRSIPDSNSYRECRNHSRTQRFSRLRTTASPTFRLIVMPSRCDPSLGSAGLGATSSTKAGSTTRRPPRPMRPMRLYSEDRRTRSPRRSRPVGPGIGLLRRRGDSQPRAALGPSAAQHRASALRLHTRAEAVHTLPTGPMRLVGPLHGGAFLDPSRVADRRAAQRSPTPYEGQRRARIAGSSTTLRVKIPARGSPRSSSVCALALPATHADERGAATRPGV